MSEPVPFAAALDAVLAHARRLELEDVPLADAVGRVLAEPVVAAVDLPPFRSSAMDGFAVRSADLPATLPIGFRVAAGRPAPRPLGAREAIGIATGAVVPDGADAVVPIEHVTLKGDTVEVPVAIEPGANVRPVGRDIERGALVAAAGVRLSAAQIGAIAAAGAVSVRCARRPHVAIVTTGSELRAPGEALGPGQIYDSNGVMLEARLRRAGARVERLASVADDAAAHRAALERGLAADVLVTSGGVSVGPHDLVREVERSLGVEEVFWRVAIKPGKPVSFAVREGTLVFGLPGNPVSSLVVCELFVLTALRALEGDPNPAPPFVTGVLASSLRRDPHRDEFVRARAVGREDGVCVLEPVTGQESHMIVRAAAADALVHVQGGEGELQPGTAARYLPLA